MNKVKIHYKECKISYVCYLGLGTELNREKLSLTPSNNSLPLFPNSIQNDVMPQCLRRRSGLKKPRLVPLTLFLLVLWLDKTLTIITSSSKYITSKIPS